MIYALCILAVVTGCMIGWCWVLWARIRELDVEKDWPVMDALPVPRPPPMPEYREPELESVKVIQAMGEAMAKIWNPPTAPENFQRDDRLEEDTEPEPDYDPWAEHEKEMLEGFMVDMVESMPVGEPPDEVD